MFAKLYTIQCHVAGLGWLTFDTTRDPAQAERLENDACRADDKRYPGKAPRRTRILADGQPLSDKPTKLLAAELFPS